MFLTQLSYLAQGAGDPTRLSSVSRPSAEKSAPELIVNVMMNLQDSQILNDGLFNAMFPPPLSKKMKK